jgi:hypothetical protein
MTANAGWQDVSADHAGLMTACGKLLPGAQDAVRQLNHLLAAPSVQVNAALVEVLQQSKYNDSKL